jgi:hypothetical protein
MRSTKGELTEEEMDEEDKVSKPPVIGTVTVASWEKAHQERRKLICEIL